ncbi:MAG TPA: tetratricopeptide repeat protein [Nitrospinota bacterium]|nr:tetratricopeptide repeat protein [Nitrospinota bacterium]
MRRTAITLLITFAVLLGSAGVSWSADLDKGFAAHKRGDYKTALREFKPLAKQGDALAQNYLGYMYEKGQGVVKDDKTAVKWYTLAAKQGHADAQNNLGEMFYNGLGVVQDFKTAVKWLTLSAEQGYAGAQNNLGGNYYNGQGVPENMVYAYMWVNIAVSSGDKNAAKNRDMVAKKMTPAEISAAQKLTRECVRKQYKGC